MLFARKRRWKDFAATAKQQAAAVGRYVSLWKTSIQTIEARHGQPHMLTAPPHAPVIYGKLHTCLMYNLKYSMRALTGQVAAQDPMCR